ncbi:hypothetical protein T260_05945 [Geobacillus thermopakistaniensis]|uniref:Uncharacterized protein n=2 Tax=Geobacillus TaxID=129337 RepID=A0A7U9JCG5_GEOTM|nr:hypothetical protein GA8_06145 [Geobacillus sp. A8]ESU72847.1 hypothetical protein T260_05945 [Geobacillus sp. MAS1]
MRRDVLLIISDREAPHFNVYIGVSGEHSMLMEDRFTIRSFGGSLVNCPFLCKPID